MSDCDWGQHEYDINRVCRHCGIDEKTQAAREGCMTGVVRGESVLQATERERDRLRGEAEKWRAASAGRWDRRALMTLARWLSGASARPGGV